MAVLLTFCKSIILSLALVYIVDLSGVMPKLNRVVFRALYGKNKPLNGWYIPLFGCSVCLSFWAVLIYTLFVEKIGIIYAVGMASLFGYIAPISGDILRVARAKIMQRISNN